MTELCGPQIFICEDTSKYPITALACTSPRLNLWSICRGLSLFHICIETICMENYQTITSFVFISLRFLTASLLFHFDGGARSWITSSVMVLTQAAVVFSHSMDSTARFNRNCLRDGHRAGMWPSWTYTSWTTTKRQIDILYIEIEIEIWYKDGCMTVNI